MIEDWNNASSEYLPSVQLANKIKEDRRIICDFIDCSTGKLFFTSGATESINTVLSLQNLELNGIDTVISSKLEHHATLERLEHLTKSDIKIQYVHNDQYGRLNLEHLNKLCSENQNAMISLLSVNNETGVISDIKSATEIAHNHNAKIHIDAVQALGKIPFSLDDLEVDYASFSGHKIGSMKGVGLLFAEEPKKLAPLINGGGQEKKVRPGTYNFSAIHSLRLAVEDIDFERNAKIEEMRNEFEKNLLQINEKISINGLDAPRVYNTSNIYLGGISSQEVMFNLSSKEIFTSTGSACSSGTMEPSHVIQNMGFDRDYARSCLRLSFGEIVDIDLLTNELIKAISN